MDTFQGSYKTAPRDLRYFSAYYLFLRYVVLQLGSIIQSAFCLPAVAFIMTLGILIFSLFQPHKSSLRNKLDLASMLVMVLLYAGLSSIIVTSFLDRSWIWMSQVFVALAIVLLAIVIICSIFYMFGQNLYKLLAKFVLRRRRRRMSRRGGRVQDRSGENQEDFVEQLDVTAEKKPLLLKI